MSQFEQFRRLAQEIEADPALKLLSFETFEPVSLEKLAKLEAEKKVVIPKALKAFYLESNGLQLRWAFNNNHLAGPQGLQAWEYPLQAFREEEGCFFYCL